LAKSRLSAIGPEWVVQPINRKVRSHPHDQSLSNGSSWADSGMSALGNRPMESGSISAMMVMAAYEQI